MHIVFVCVHIFNVTAYQLQGKDFFVRECGVGESLHVCVRFNLPRAIFRRDSLDGVCDLFVLKVPNRASNSRTTQKVILYKSC